MHGQLNVKCVQCLLLLSSQTAITSLRNIKLFVLACTRCLFETVRTEFLNITYISFTALNDHYLLLLQGHFDAHYTHISSTYFRFAPSIVMILKKKSMRLAWRGACMSELRYGYNITWKREVNISFAGNEWVNVHVD